MQDDARELRVENARLREKVEQLCDKVRETEMKVIRQAGLQDDEAKVREEETRRLEDALQRQEEYARQ